MANYIETNLQRDEQLTHRAKLHPIIFLVPLAIFAVSMFAFLGAALTDSTGLRVLLTIGSFIGTALAIFRMLMAAVRWATTEMGVTNRRVLIKTGFIARRTLELRLDRIETVSVDQGILGRMLGYGSVTIIGTGGTHEPFTDVDDPIGFRVAVAHFTDRAVAPRAGLATVAG